MNLRHSLRPTSLPFQTAVLVLGVLLGVAVGSSWMPVREVLAALGDLVGIGSGTSEVKQYIVLNVRLPRVLAAVFVGAALAVSGAALQSLFRNPLAEPGLVGISAGGTLGAVIIIVLGTTLFPVFYKSFGQFLLPIVAFIGAVLTAVLVFKIASHRGNTQTATLLLAGIAIQALVFSVVGFLLTIASDAEVRSITFWSLGSLKQANWDALLIIILTISGSIISLLALSKPLNLLLLGEAEARHLGIRVQRTKIFVVILVTLAVGVSVAFFGIIGFVGLVVPHLLRLTDGPNLKQLLPASALLGANLLVYADLLSRSITVEEIPIGVITSAIGAPFFIWLLLRQRKLQLL